MTQGSAPCTVAIRVLGGFTLQSRGNPLRLESVKTAALLTYLALNPGGHTRTKLQALLWPDLPAGHAARNLRHALWDIRKTFAAVGASVLATDRTHVAFAGGTGMVVDALALLAASEALRCGRELSLPPDLVAADLVRGELLEGVLLADAAPFDEWLVVERERLHMAAQDLVLKLVERHRQRGELEAALVWARHLVALDPWREEAHRHVMELEAIRGEPAAALAQFEECRRILAEQLQTAPTAETVRLAERIRGAAGATTPNIPPSPRHNLPAQTTPFIGREPEIEAIDRMLATPGCRLMCLLGPGGIGKTRLALQIGLRQLFDRARADRFADGVWFVAPREGEPRSLATLLADAVFSSHPPTPEPSDPETRLLDYLRARNVLVIIDAFEHILAEADCLAALLQKAPSLVVLATSRERLPVDGAWTLVVGGLPTSPPAGSPRRPSPAFQLFVEAARRTRFGFSPSPREAGAINALCIAVEGSPLAIELAGAWTGTLPVASIAMEVMRHPGLLGEPAGKLRAIFTSSWNRLQPEDQVALAALSVFVGGCTREAAEEVAGASLATLRRLVDHSFVRHEASGRYTVHDVLRRFSREELERQPAELERVQATHGEFFARFVKELEGRKTHEDERASLDRFAADLDNVQAAWGWALSHDRLDVIADCLGGVLTYAESRGWFHGAEALLSDAIDRVALRHPRLLLDLLVGRGTLRNRQGKYSLAERDLSRALALPDPEGEGHARALAQLGAASYYQGRHKEARQRLEQALDMGSAFPLTGMCTSLLGRVALEQGRHGEAEALFEQALSLARETGDSVGERRAVYQLGLMAYFRSDLVRSQELFEDALDQAQRAGDLILMKDALAGLGYIAEDRAAFADAQAYYGQVLAFSRDIGDRRGEAYALILRGEALRRSGTFAEARDAYEAALEIARELGSVYFVGILLGNLAMMAAATGDLDEAEPRIRHLLEEYRRGASVVTVLPAVVAAAEVLHRRGKSRRALELLGLVLAHPANRQDHTGEVERVLAAIASTLPPRMVRSGLRAGRALDLDNELERLLAPGGLGHPPFLRPLPSQDASLRPRPRRSRRSSPP